MVAGAVPHRSHALTTLNIPSRVVAEVAILPLRDRMASSMASEIVKLSRICGAGSPVRFEVEIAMTEL